MATGKSSGNAIKAGEAFVELNADDSRFRNVLTKASEKFKRFGGMIKNIGIGSAGLGTAIVAPLVAGAFATLKYIDSIQDIADRTNSSTEAVSRLGFAAKLSATSLEDIEAGNKKLTKSAVDAAAGSEEQATAFKLMEVSAEDFLALDMDERFVKIAETLDELEDPLQRSRFLIALLGKQAATLTPLLGEGGEGLRKLFREAESVGAVVRGEDGKKAASTMDALDTVLTSVKSTLVELGLAVFSLGEDTREGQRIVLMYLKMGRDWIKENKKLVGIIVLVGGALIVTGVILGVVGALIGGIATGIGVVVTIGSVLIGILGGITLAGIVITAVIIGIVAALVYMIRYFFLFTELGRNIGEVWIRNFAKIGEAFGVMWSGILGALRKGDLKLAGEIAFMGLYLAWLGTVMSLKETWFQFINFFVEGFVSAISLIRAYFAKLVSFMKIAGLSAVVFIAKQAAELFKGLGIEQLNDLIKSMQEFSKLAQDMINTEMKSQIKVEAGIFAEGDAFNKDRMDKQEAVIIQDADDIDKLIKLLETMNKIANQPIVVPPILPVAPMPHAAGGKVDANLGMLGNSVKGLFDSADFAGVLGLGEANSYAKESRDLQRNMLTELRLLNMKGGPQFD